ncbi:hypothetical protein LT85_1224 [Collimonas arenae]|uniref:Uncharacterized protein n=1 Tax=Collimonas arenae TaxID=279058 RepID=A0A0A1FBZ9_9BURK|nr:hypothetical protein LT85_1224 [Collimonas arenae]
MRLTEERSGGDCITHGFYRQQLIYKRMENSTTANMTKNPDLFYIPRKLRQSVRPSYNAAP